MLKNQSDKRVTAIQDKMDPDNLSKLTATQNVIRNKFKKAYTNRLEREHDVNRAMKPLTSSSTTTSLTNESGFKKKDEFSNHSIESRAIDSNELCNSLRKLLTSQIVDNVNHTHEINSIIEQLRELKIII